MSKKKILISINSDWFFLLHRVPIAKALQEKGYDVIILANDTGKKKEIEKLGFQFVHISINRKGINPIKELKTFIDYYRAYKKNRPDVAYQITIKPIIYGQLISRFLKVNTVNTVCGLGYVFSNNKKTILKRIVALAYKLAFKSTNSHTFFENRDDLKTFLDLKIISSSTKFSVVNGVGVDLQKFKPVRMDDGLDKKPVEIVLASRMLWNKGVKEFVNAAMQLKDNYSGELSFKLYGMIDKGNKEFVPESYLQSILIPGYIKWYDFVIDMVSVYKNSDIVVLPSYYGEGLPTVLAEACAMGKPIITTESVGCRECIDEGVNGFKIPIKSASKLAKAIEVLITNKDLRIEMGIASRLKAERDFDQNEIVNQYLKVFEKMINA